MALISDHQMLYENIYNLLTHHDLMVKFCKSLTVKLLLSRLNIVVNWANCMSDGIEKFLIKVQERL